MIGLIVAAVGVAVLSVGLVIEFGIWTLIPVGVVLVAAGLLVDWERLHGKRH